LNRQDLNCADEYRLVVRVFGIKQTCVARRFVLKGHGFSRADDESIEAAALAAGGRFLKPAREHTTTNAQTYFVTSDTWERRALFRTESWARLFFKTLLAYRGKGYLLHEFVLMPDHFHLLITPLKSLERAVQFIKGGFSHQAKKELGSNAEIWRRGFADHRIRDAEDYDKHVHYIHLNPVKKLRCTSPAEYRYSSAYPGWNLDPVPQELKPFHLVGIESGTAEAVPFQNMDKAQNRNGRKS
jgi:putative transposase